MASKLGSEAVYSSVRQARQLEAPYTRLHPLAEPCDLCFESLALTTRPLHVGKERIALFLLLCQDFLDIRNRLLARSPTWNFSSSTSRVVRVRLSPDHSLGSRSLSKASGSPGVAYLRYPRSPRRRASKYPDGTRPSLGRSRGDQTCHRRQQLALASRACGELRCATKQNQPESRSTTGPGDATLASSHCWLNS